MARYRVELSDKILESEEEYQNAVDRLADVKRHQSQFLLQEATVCIFAVTNGANSVFIPVVSTSTRSEIVIKIEEKKYVGFVKHRTFPPEAGVHVPFGTKSQRDFPFN